MKELFLCFVLLTISNFTYAQGASTLDSKQKLVVVIGEEFIARHEETLILNLKKGNTVEVKKLMVTLESTLDDVDCFNVSDFFCNQENNYPPYRDFNMTDWAQLMLDCPEIMNSVDKPDGLKNLVLFYVMKDIIYKDVI